MIARAYGRGCIDRQVYCSTQNIGTGDPTRRMEGSLMVRCREGKQNALDAGTGEFIVISGR